MNNEAKKYNVGETLFSTGSIRKFKSEKLEKPMHFYIRPLKREDSHAMADLSFCIYENLREGQECFIHKHDKKYYQTVFDDANIQYVGAFIGKSLIGMGRICLIETEAELAAELPGHNLDFKDRKIAAFGDESVHPDFRGNNLNTHMVDYRMDLAKSLGVDDCVSIIDRKNVWNMSPFFSNGFSMFGSAIDPADNGKISLMHRALDRPVEINANNFEIMRFDELGQVDRILNSGKVGVKYMPESQSLVFVETSHYKNMRRNTYSNNRSRVRTGPER